jgi:hypothetical protein
LKIKRLYTQAHSFIGTETREKNQTVPPPAEEESGISPPELAF